MASAFSDGLNAVGVALEGLGDSIGTWFSNLSSTIVNWLSSVVDNISSFSSKVGQWFGGLTTDLGNWFSNVGSWFTTLGDRIGDWFKPIIEAIGDFLRWFNPFHDDFILKVAFVPSDTYMQDYKQKFDGLISTKFGFVTQTADTLKSFVTAVKSQVSTWQGITIDLSKWGAGEVPIVSGHAIQEYGEKIRFWIGGLMIFLTGAWLVRKGSKLLGEGR